jgi:hypothetical protein
MPRREDIPAKAGAGTGTGSLNSRVSQLVLEVAAVTQGPVKEMGEDAVPRLVPFVNETLLLKVTYGGVSV